MQLFCFTVRFIQSDERLRCVYVGDPALQSGTYVSPCASWEAAFDHSKAYQPGGGTYRHGQPRRWNISDAVRMLHVSLKLLYIFSDLLLEEFMHFSLWRSNACPAHNTHSTYPPITLQIAFMFDSFCSHSEAFLFSQCSVFTNILAFLLTEFPFQWFCLLKRCWCWIF